MRRKDAKREAARELRADGWSVRRIAAELDVAKSSVSVWVRDVPAARPEEPPAPVSSATPPVVRPSGDRQVCARCRRSLPVESFNRRGDGRQAYCRGCFAAYFRERGDLHRRQVSATAPRRRRRAREHMLSLLTESRCADCGSTDPLVLEFDHVEAKTSTVSSLVGSTATPRRLAEEIAKCDVVCANCHRRRTASRAGWFRATGREGALWSAAQRRNHQHIAEALRRSPCCDCGEDNIVVLEFDHRGEKRGNVSTMATWASLDTLREEIAKCDVRCANCHRRRTQIALKSYRAAALESDAPP